LIHRPAEPVIAASMSQPADDVRLSPRHVLTLHAVACVLFLSGGAAALQDILAAAGHDDVVPLSLKAWALAVHGGAAMVFLVLLGSILPTHVVAAWRSGRNRLIGVVLLAVFALLIITGYGLYYFSGERLRVATQWTHLALGIAEPVVFLVHLVRGRRSRPTA
jgi:hypothetical protein